MFQKLVFVAICLAFVTKTGAIIGGEDAGRNEFPWLVRFAVGERFCSGALLKMDLVLTSATCVQYYVDPIDIVAGDHSPLEQDGTEQTQISHYPILHENFNKNGQLENNIALIRLFTPFSITPYVRPIRLPVANPHLEDAGQALLAGWGETSVTKSADGNLRFFPGMSAVLQKAKLGYTNASFCAENFDVQLPEGQFCTHGNGGAEMDKGGPLLCDDQPGQVCGILSNVWLKHSEHETTVGSYVQVNKYIDWISLNSLKPTTTPSPTVAPTTPSPGGGGSGGGSENSGGIGTIIVKVENNTSTLMLILLIALCFIMIATSGVLMWKFISLKQEARLTESRIDLSRDFYRNSGAEAGNPAKGDYRV